MFKNVLQVGFIFASINNVFSSNLSDLYEPKKNLTNFFVYGDGYIPLRNLDEPAGKILFCKGGDFQLNCDNNLVNDYGQALNVFLTSHSGSLLDEVLTVDTLTTLNVRDFKVLPYDSCSVSLKMNLNAAAAIGDVYNLLFDVIDSLGVVHNLTMTWTKQSKCNFVSSDVESKWLLQVDDEQGLDIINDEYRTGIFINFDGRGKLLNIPPQLIINWSNGADPSYIYLDIGYIGQSDGVTALGDYYQIDKVLIDGFALGSFDEISIDSEGYAQVLCANGETVAYGRIPLFHFSDDELNELGFGVFETKPEVKISHCYFPGENGMEKLVSGLIGYNIDGTPNHLKIIKNLELRIAALEKSMRGLIEK